MTVLVDIMPFWNEPCIDTTTDAIEILNLYNKTIENPEEIINYAKTLYTKDEGFRLLMGRYKTHGFMYANRYAFDLDETARKNWNMNLITPEMKGEIKEFIKKCESEEDGKIGYRYHPELGNYCQRERKKDITIQTLREHIPEEEVEEIKKKIKHEVAPLEVYSTYNAVKILTENNWLEKEKVPKIINFIDSRLEEFKTKKNHNAAGFRNVKTENPRIQITYYALDTIRKLYNYIEEPEKFQDYLNEDNKKDKIINFLTSEWIDGKGYGGFCVKGQKMILTYQTYHALRILHDILETDVGALKLTSKKPSKISKKEKIEKKIINGLTMNLASMGFGMEPDRLPTVFGTLYAVKIFKTLGREDLMEKYKDGNLKFLNACRENGGYKGYDYDLFSKPNPNSSFFKRKKKDS